MSPTSDDSLPRELNVACVVVAIEALGLLVAAVWLVVDSAAGHTAHPARGLVTAVLALIGAAALLLAARGLRRLSLSARTPVVVLQILALPVAYTMAFQAHRPTWGGPILVAALVVLYCLFTPPVRAIFDRQPRD